MTKKELIERVKILEIKLNNIINNINKRIDILENPSLYKKGDFVKEKKTNKKYRILSFKLDYSIENYFNGYYYTVLDDDFNKYIFYETLLEKINKKKIKINGE